MEECGVTAEQYHNALGCVEKKVSILHKEKPCEVNVGPHNTVTLKLSKSNMNFHIYPSKPEHAMSELMKKASKETYSPLDRCQIDIKL